MPDINLIRSIENFLFNRRKFVIIMFVLVTLFMSWSMMHLKVDAGFSKMLPLQHDYMKTFMKYSDEFGGANRILVALTVKQGDIFTPEFFKTLKLATDEVFFIPGVDRSRVTSLFTPNVRFTEVVEDGITGGNVIPDDFQGTESDLLRVKENIIKAGILGRLVANDFSGALISAQLLEIEPNTGEKLDYVKVAEQLEEKIRQNNFQVDVDVDFHIIGFAKVIGDITEGAKRTLLFFAISFLITSLLVYYYSQSISIALVPICCSVIAVIWQLGMLPLLGFGIDPMSILVPFLIFAIGVSHGVQMISAVRVEIYLGEHGVEAARKSFRRLFVPGMVALASDCIGFITILLIKIEIIQEMAITASLGVAMIIFTNLFLLPVLASYQDSKKTYQASLNKRAAFLAPVWNSISKLTNRSASIFIVIVAAILFVFGVWKGAQIKIGDLHRGVPELHGDSRYNMDTDTITDRFSIGVDVITVITETVTEGCINYEVMELIDRFEWHMRNTKGVQSVVALPSITKRINAGWNEGNMKWRVLPRNPSVLTQSVAYVPTSSGLLNSDCSVMPVLIFTEDHKAETIDAIIDSVNKFKEVNPSDTTKFKLATGNVGVMAATNEEINAAQFPILVYVFSAIILLCLITFKSIRAMLCIVLPLALVSVLAYALMAYLKIGLKVNTLPVVALGVGIGVDYGIYFYSRFNECLKKGMSIKNAYIYSLSTTGFSIIFTGITLAVGVITWIFSPLKFQADMGILLTFMFLLNMLGAIFLLPAIASLVFKDKQGKDGVLPDT
ncbi:MAG: RND family transporter [Proteobacteria bacterium]|nr:RND family transporter [Pseudomonadota bacterium]NOG61374.1 RND family transporter [Pseudomonadota bacterium]